MAGLTSDRDTHEYVPGTAEYEWPVADNVKIFNGAMIGIDANGRLTPCTLSTSILPVGRSIMFADNTVAGHTAGGITCKFHIGVFRWDNVGSITIASRGQLAYVVDDHSVQTSSTGASPAGPIVDVDASGVWVTMGVNFGSAVLSEALAALKTEMNPITIPCVLAAHTTGSIAARFTPGFAGTILNMTASVVNPTTTAGKLGTFTPAVAATPTTGGSVALTSANTGVVGAKVNGTPVTAGAAFTAAQELTIVSSGVTAFVEGEVVFYLFVQPS